MPEDATEQALANAQPRWLKTGGLCPGLTPLEQVTPAVPQPTLRESRARGGKQHGDGNR